MNLSLLLQTHLKKGSSKVYTSKKEHNKFFIYNQVQFILYSEEYYYKMSILLEDLIRISKLISKTNSWWMVVALWFQIPPNLTVLPATTLTVAWSCLPLLTFQRFTLCLNWRLIWLCIFDQILALFITTSQVTPCTH